MPCDTRLKKNQTIQQRAKEVRDVVSFLDELLRKGKVTAKVGPQGGITFVGMTDSEKDGVTDACAYRRLMVSGSATAKAAIAKAEMLAGRAVDRRALQIGVHSHDGGESWHGHKG